MVAQNWFSGPPRVAIYSQDGLGLGHMRRTSSIAKKFLQMRPDAGVLTLSDSRLGQFFPTHPNHDYLKLPSIVKSGPGDWRAASLPMDFHSVLEMRKQLIASALATFAPHILLVDHMPHGAMGELLPGLEALRRAGIPTRVILGLRDIVDASEVVQRRWHEEGAYEALEQYYDRVLVYGMRDVYDVSEHYGLPPSIASRVRYCGYVCSPDPVHSVDRIRARYLAGAPQDTRLLVAMAGGGADAYPLMQNLIDALPLLQPSGRYVIAMITGPFLPAEQLAELHRRARRLPIHIIQSVDNTLAYIQAADLVVAMAGYNTTMEILRMKKPAVLVPRRGPSAEQRTRTRLFSSRRWIESLDPDDLSPDRLSDRIKACLRCPPTWPAHNRPDLHGLVVAAYQLLALLYSESELIPLAAGVYAPV